MLSVCNFDVILQQERQMHDANLAEVIKCRDRKNVGLYAKHVFNNDKLINR